MWKLSQGFQIGLLISQGNYLFQFQIIFKHLYKITLGKHHYKKISVHLGIAQIAIRPTPPQSNGHSVAPIFGQNHAIARLYMDIIPKNRCHKPSWQGFRPPHPNGQCPNEQRFFYSGASLSWGIKVSK